MSLEKRVLSHSDKLDWLRLIRSERVGPITFYKLMEQFGSAQAALEALPDLAKRGGARKKLKIAAKAAVEREVEALTKMGGAFVAWPEPVYPGPLRHIEDAPPILAVRGHLDVLRRQGLGVVGARNASLNGRKLAFQLAKELGEAGLVINSGGARGLDGAAHEGALSTGTVAYLGCGVDVVYPKEHTDLFARIEETGAMVSEFVLGEAPNSRNFPKRNRLISGASYGVLVVEANARSGSLITARQALEQGREVFAIPGSPLDPRSEGPNSLIKQGAQLVTEASDILSALEPLLRAPMREPSSGDFSAPPATSLDENEVAESRDLVLECLGLSPVSVDEIIRQCQLSPSVVATILLELELAGRLDRHAGNRVSRLAE